MNTDKFKIDLRSALVLELNERVKKYSKYIMRSFDLGIYPWHGYIELSFFTTEDETTETEIADWILYNFADTPEGKWPKVKKIAEWMNEFYRTNPSINSLSIFQAAAEVMKDEEVVYALKKFNRLPSFYISVYNPDDPKFFNFVTSQYVK